MEEQLHLVCRREKEIDRLLDECDDFRKILDSKMNTATFWTIIGVAITVMSIGIGLFVQEDRRELASLSTRISALSQNQIASDKVQVRIETQLAEIQKQLVEINLKLTKIK